MEIMRATICLLINLKSLKIKLKMKQINIAILLKKFVRLETKFCHIIMEFMKDILQTFVLWDMLTPENLH